ncbi:hypothetical protein RLIN73S_04217 [Rhodanobacter lindaniclasticus]
MGTAFPCYVATIYGRLSPKSCTGMCCGGHAVCQPAAQSAATPARAAVRIELTDAGQAVWRQLTDCNERVLNAAQRPLNEAEQAQLHDYLERVLHALRNKH